MTTDNTEIDQELDEVTLDNNANEEQAIAEELSVEEQMALDLANEKDKYLRLFAEFENYKRRTTKERIELFKTANQEVLLALLPVLDDFDRAITEISKTDDGPLLEGVALINEKLKTTLVSKGLEQVDVKVGDVFDADFAEAITQIPAPSDKLKGKIVDFFCVFGRVPFFYYIIHLYLIHFLALLAAEFTGFGWQSMILPKFVTRVEALKGYGFNLIIVYLIWFVVIALLYPLCKKFDNYKQSHKEKWWLSYL